MRVLRELSELASWAAETDPHGKGSTPQPAALTIGFFDGVHLGHKHLLARLASAALNQNLRSLVVTFANPPYAFHHPNEECFYITTPDEKLRLLARTGVDAALILDYDAAIANQSAAQFIRGIDRHTTLTALCVGYDGKLGSDQVSGRAGFASLAAGLGVELIYVEPYILDGRPVKSTTARELVRTGAMAGAHTLMGHPYFVMERVVRCKGKGARKLRIPTANVLPPPGKLTPPTGVYAGLAEVAGTTYLAAICVMSSAQARQTALERQEPEAAPPGGQRQVVIETHLLDFSGDLYGVEIAVHFLKRLRDWVEFATAAELHTQILVDIENVRASAAAMPDVSEV